MRSVIWFVLLAIVIVSVPRVDGFRPVDPEGVFSPSGAKAVYEIARDLYSSASEKQFEMNDQLAMLMLIAALEMDQDGGYVYADVIRLGNRDIRGNSANAVRSALEQYISRDANTAIAREGIVYLLDALGYREQREQLLSSLIRISEDRNEALTSLLQTQLGILASEKADFPTAQKHLLAAYKLNPYNELTFGKLTDIHRRLESPVPPVQFFIHYRSRLQADPYDLEAALRYAQMARDLAVFEIATVAYQYSAILFTYLNPQAPLPPFIYEPWTLCALRTGSYTTCLEIAQRIREQDQFNLVAEAAAGLAAKKLDDTQQSGEYFSAVGRAESLVESSEGASVSPALIAWFYQFALPNTDKALAWANRAYGKDPNSIPVKGLLANALVESGQTDLGREMAMSIYEQSQAAGIAYAKVLFLDEKRDQALEVLKETVLLAPESLEAQAADDLLEENGSTFIPPVPTGDILQAVNRGFNERIVPTFHEIDDRITVKLTFGGDEFAYGSDLTADLILLNNSNVPIILTGDGFYHGHVRIDAVVSGDINRKIERLIDGMYTFGPQINPGQYYSIEVELLRSELRSLVMSHPQAQLDIEFYVYIDPQVDESGEIVRSMTGRPDAVKLIKRPPVGLTRSYLIQRFNTLSKGTVGQRLKVLELFAGLLREQYAFEEEAEYRYIYVERSLLEDALRLALEDNDWIVRMHTLTMLSEFESDLPFEMIQAVSENINSDNWAIRMLSLFVLAKQESSQFDQVLDWVAKYESRPLVQSIAVALGGEPPEPTQQQAPPQQPDLPEAEITPGMMIE